MKKKNTSIEAKSLPSSLVDRDLNYKIPLVSGRDFVTLQGSSDRTYNPPKTLEEAGRVEVSVEEDGDCLFTALILSLGLQKTPEELR